MKYVSFLFSAVSAALKVSGCAASGDGGVTCKVKEERITQDTLQIKVSVRWSAVIHHAAGRSRRPALPSEGLKSSPRLRAVMKMKLWEDKFLVTHSSLLICKRLRDDSGLPGYRRPPHCFLPRSIFFFLLLLCRGSSTSLPWDDETCFSLPFAEMPSQLQVKVVIWSRGSLLSDWIQFTFQGNVRVMF